MKKPILLILIAMFSLLWAAKKIYVHNSDGTVYSREISLVDSIIFKEEIAMEKGTVSFAILSEAVSYNNLSFDHNLNLNSATIDYAYMLIANPTLNPNHGNSNERHMGCKLTGLWAVNLLGTTPIHLGYNDADAGSYEVPPNINIKQPFDWSTVVDKGGLALLQEKEASLLLGGTLFDTYGKEYPYEIRVALNANIQVENFPSQVNGEKGTKLSLQSNDTLPVIFHPHIARTLEPLNDYSIDLGSLETENGVIIISDKMNTQIQTRPTASLDLYSAIIDAIMIGAHWDVNIIP